MKLLINGESYEVQQASGRFLLWVIRNDLGLTGTKFGCGVGICGSCTVLVDGVPTRSCITQADTVEGQAITTIEGLATEDDEGHVHLHPVQQAFVEAQTPQCSWCMSGQMLTAAAFLENQPHPSKEQIDEAMKNNYCRCGTYERIRSAILIANETMHGPSSS